MNETGKAGCITAVIICLTIIAGPILAQNDAGAGWTAGEKAARESTNATLWFLTGCVGGLLLVYFIEPRIPALPLLGKSAEYTAAYTDAYRETAKSIQSRKAIEGCIASTMLYIMAYVLYFAVLMSPEDF